MHFKYLFYFHCIKVVQYFFKGQKEIYINHQKQVDSTQEVPKTTYKKPSYNTMSKETKAKQGKERKQAKNQQIDKKYD